MASNISKLIRERTVTSTHPLYFRDGATVPEAIDPGRVVFVKRQYVDPPAREEDALPEAQVAGDVFGAETKRPDRFSRYIDYPNLGIV